MILHILRLSLYTFLFYNLYLWWQDFVNPVIFFIMQCLAVGLAYYYPKKFTTKKELLYYFVPLLFGVFAIRLIFVLLEFLFFGNSPILLVLLDLNLFPSLVPFYILFFTTYYLLKNNQFAKYEIFIRLVLLFIIFFATLNYKLFFYSHYTLFLVSIGFYLFVEALNLFCINYQNNNIKLNIKTNNYLYKKVLAMVIVLLLTLATLPLVFNIISKQMVQYASGLLKPDLDNFDFSKEIKLEDQISLGKDLLLLLKTKEPLTKRVLFKRYTLAGYNGEKGFYHINNMGDTETIGNSPFNIKFDNSIYHNKLEQEFFIINLEANALLGANKIVSIKPYHLYSNSSFKNAYGVESYLVDIVNAKQTSNNNSFSVLEKEIYLKQDASDELKVLASSLTTGKESNLQKAIAIESYFKENFYYTLKPGKGEFGKTKIDNFVLLDKKGYCSYFAFAMALMMRSIDVPSRVAVGFFAEPKLLKNGYYPITSSEAHAWVEVYLGDLGWVSFDPTSSKLNPTELGNTMANDFTSQIENLINELNNNKDKLTMVKDKPKTKQDNNLQENIFTTITKYKIFIILALPIIIVIVVYFIILYRFKCKFNFKDSDTIQEKTFKSIKEYFVLYQLVNSKNTTKTDFIEFLEQQKLLEFYRKALYSPSFTNGDFYEVSNIINVGKASIYNNLDWHKKVLISLNIKQIFLLHGVH